MKTREVGTVLWFNCRKRFGFIKRESDNKHYYIHFKNIRGDGYRFLVEGQIVKFSINLNEKNLEFAQDVEVFDDEQAKEIRLILALGLFKSAGAGSQLQESFSRNPIFERKLIPMIFDYAELSQKKIR